MTLSGNLREATRSVHVSYPVPYVATVFGLMGLAALGLATAFTGWAMVFVLGLGGMFSVAAVFAVTWSLLRRPELMKSERYVFLDKMIGIIGDDSMDAAARARLHSEIIGTLSEPRSAKPTRLAAPPAADSDDKGERP